MAAGSPNPIRVSASTARTVVRSMISRSEGVTGPATTSATAAAAASSEGKVATAVSAGAGAGSSRSTTSVTTPSVPSEPTSRRVRS